MTFNNNNINNNNNNNNSNNNNDSNNNNNADYCTFNTLESLYAINWLDVISAGPQQLDKCLKSINANNNNFALSPQQIFEIIRPLGDIYIDDYINNNTTTTTTTTTTSNDTNNNDKLLSDENKSVIIINVAKIIQNHPPGNNYSLLVFYSKFLAVLAAPSTNNIYLISSISFLTSHFSGLKEGQNALTDTIQSWLSNFDSNSHHSIIGALVLLTALFYTNPLLATEILSSNVEFPNKLQKLNNSQNLILPTLEMLSSACVSHAGRNVVLNFYHGFLFNSLSFSYSSSSEYFLLVRSVSATVLIKSFPQSVSSSVSSSPSEKQKLIQDAQAQMFELCAVLVDIISSFPDAKDNNNNTKIQNPNEYLANALEGLAYATLNIPIRKEIAANHALMSKLISFLSCPKSIHSSIVYGILVILENLTRIDIAQNESASAMQKLKAYADAASSNGIIFSESPEEVIERCRKFSFDHQSLIPGLISLATNTSSARIISKSSSIISNLASSKDLRPILREKGALRVLTAVSISGFEPETEPPSSPSLSNNKNYNKKNNDESNISKKFSGLTFRNRVNSMSSVSSNSSSTSVSSPSIGVHKNNNEKRNNGSLATVNDAIIATRGLARIAISSDPNLFTMPIAVIIKPLITLLTLAEGTFTDHETYLSNNFNPEDLTIQDEYDCLLALTNLAIIPSASTAIINGLHNTIDSLLLSTDRPSLQTATVELACNLVATPAGAAFFLIGSTSKTRNLNSSTSLSSLPSAASSRVNSSNNLLDHSNLTMSSGIENNGINTENAIEEERRKQQKEMIRSARTRLGILVSLTLCKRDRAREAALGALATMVVRWASGWKAIIRLRNEHGHYVAIETLIKCLQRINNDSPSIKIRLVTCFHALVLSGGEEAHLAVLSAAHGKSLIVAVLRKAIESVRDDPETASLVSDLIELVHVFV